MFIFELSFAIRKQRLLALFIAQRKRGQTSIAMSGESTERYVLNKYAPLTKFEIVNSA